MALLLPASIARQVQYIPLSGECCTSFSVQYMRPSSHIASALPFSAPRRNQWKAFLRSLGHPMPK
jgi:hypothetical protein